MTSHPAGDSGRGSEPGGPVRIGPIEQALLAWVCMLGTDFLVHGGLLHSRYLEDSSFLLPPRDAFRLIPLGYASFLVMAGLVVWLVRRQEVRGWKEGTTFGLIFGGAVSVAAYAGLASITTAPISLLVAWGMGQTVQIGLAGTVVGAARGTASRRKLWTLVAGWCGFCLVVAITMQSLR